MAPFPDRIYVRKMCDSKRIASSTPNFIQNPGQITSCRALPERRQVSVVRDKVWWVQQCINVGTSCSLRKPESCSVVVMPNAYNINPRPILWHTMIACIDDLVVLCIDDISQQCPVVSHVSVLMVVLLLVCCSRACLRQLHVFFGFLLRCH